MVRLQHLLEAGITYRQADTWTNLGHLRAAERADGAGSGVPREWQDGEQLVARRMKRLIDAGVTLARAAQLARAGEGEHEVTPHVRVTLRA